MPSEMETVASFEGSVSDRERLEAGFCFLIWMLWGGCLVCENSLSYSLTGIFLTYVRL